MLYHINYNPTAINYLKITREIIYKFQRNEHRLCRIIIMAMMIDHIPKIIQIQETELDQSAIMNIMGQDQIQFMKITVMIITTMTKDTTVMEEITENITMMDADHRKECITNMTTEITEGIKQVHRLQYHTEEQVLFEALEEEGAGSENNKVLNTYITEHNKYLIIKIYEYLKITNLVWESRLNWTATPGSRYEIPESAIARAKRRGAKITLM